MLISAPQSCVRWNKLSGASDVADRWQHVRPETIKCEVVLIRPTVAIPHFNAQKLHSRNNNCTGRFYIAPLEEKQQHTNSLWGYRYPFYNNEWNFPGTFLLYMLNRIQISTQPTNTNMYTKYRIQISTCIPKRKQKVGG